MGLPTYSSRPTAHAEATVPRLLPLSPAQLALWHAQAIDPVNPIFNQAEYLEISGPILPELFAQATEIAVAETDALHLRFVETESGPQQYADTDPGWRLSYFDVSAQPEPQASAQSWMLANMAKPDDLTKGHCFTCALFRCAPDRYFYYQRAHHIICDGAGALLFAQRVAAIYSALVEGKQAPPANSGSCFELLNEDEKYRSSNNFERDREYWRQQLSDLPEAVTLSGKAPSRASRSISCKAEVSPAKLQTVMEIARTRGCSLPQVITAACAVYLHRLTGADDLVLGMPVAARVGRRMRNIVGVVSDVLPLRVSVDPSMSFSTVLREVAKAMRDVLRHQRYRSEDIRRDLGLRANQLNLYGTLSNVMSFDYQIQFGRSPSREHDLAHGPIDDLAILAYDRLDGSDLRLSFFANPANYTEDDLATHRQQFLTLLSSLGSDWDKPIHKLAILDDQERSRLLPKIKDARPEKLLPALVEDFAARTPQEAIMFGGQSVHFRELNGQANGIAQVLLGRKLCAQAVIAIALEPSIEMAASAVAVLKAGFVYTIIDVNEPLTRIARLLRESSAALVITKPEFLSSLPQSIEPLLLDRGDIADASSAGDPASQIVASSPACIAYSSNHSRPLAVVLSHANLRQLFELKEPFSQALARILSLHRSPETSMCLAVNQAVSGLQVYVLDAGLEFLPIGVPGEMYVSGPLVADGYLSQPGVTAERFVADPYSAVPGSRMFRSGDVVRRRPDGTLQWIGRSDGRAFAEIEDALCSIPEVAGAAVLANNAAGEDIAAFVVLRDGVNLEPTTLRSALEQQLPKRLIPSQIVRMDGLPLTRKDQVDRRALLAARRSLQHRPASEMERLVASVWKRVLKLEHIGVHDNFFEAGGDSLLVTQVLEELRKELNQPLNITDLFQHTSISSVAAYLTRMQHAAKTIDYRKRHQYRRSDQHASDIAIIGLSCRFPDASNPSEFWRNLCAGRESVRTFSDAEMLRVDGNPQNRGKRNFVDRGVVLDSFDQFDAGFWGYTPREAELLDPQQRIFLECCWEALEDAGYDPSRAQEFIGVFGGADLSAYMFGLQRDAAIMNEIGPFALAVGADKDYLTTRVAYKLNLRGPAITMQTACSSSLVAVSQGCKELILGQCELALAGGTGAATWLEAGYYWQEGGILSPDGRCRAFDANAAGTIFGTGAGVVLLKRYEEAVANGDNIYAVIRGFGINNDGSEKVGYTAPGIEGQKRAISAALEMSGVHPDTITYIEAHGTGTKLGDPIEIAALTQVFRKQTDRKQYCALSSVKTNIGHLGAAAGVASLIKTVLALKHRMLPPSLNFESPNPNIDFESSPFFVNDRIRPWANGSGTRRAGINSFGIGGTNAHVLLEEAPDRVSSQNGRSWQMLPVSAKTHATLERASTNLSKWLQTEPETNLADAAYTLQVGRQAFRWRRAVVAESGQAAEAGHALLAGDIQRVFSGQCSTAPPNIVFLFPGQGVQHVGMARELYDLEPVFREHVDACSEIFAADTGTDLREILYPADQSGLNHQQCAAKLAQTEITQPALFTIEYALARLWMSWGVQPDAMAGHSIGEYVAACLAGVMSAPDALRLVIERGKLMQSMPGGAMLSVHLPATELKWFATNGLSVAAENAPSLCVLSGTLNSIEKLEAELAEKSVHFSRLHTSHAFHSVMMDPIVQPFVDRIRQIGLKAPTVPFVSNLTGTWITPEQATDPEYWGQHLRRTVRFSENVKALQDGKSALFLEVGPGRTLTSLAVQTAGEQLIVACSLPRPQDTAPAFRTLMSAVSTLWVNGADIDWAALHSGERRVRLSLPTYPFDRQRFWVKTSSPAAKAEGRLSSASGRSDLADWFYSPVWKLTPRAQGTDARTHGRWLVLGGSDPNLDRVISSMEHCGEQIRLRATLGDDLDPSDPSGFRDVLRELHRSDGAPRILLWCNADGTHLPNEHFDTAPEFFTLMNLAKAIGREFTAHKVEVAVVTRAAVQVSPCEDVCPKQAMLTAAARVIAQEYQNVKVQVLDIQCSVAQNIVEDLCAELLSMSTDPLIALRDSGRWTIDYCSLHLEPTGGARRVRKGGVYFITGGLGGMGLTFARSLAQKYQAKLVLISRSKLPERSQWAEWLSTHAADDGVSRKLREIEAMEAAGAEVLPLSADTADISAMRNVVHIVRERFGAVNGVIHAAGVAGGNLIQLRTMDKAAAVLAPKVKGTEIVYQLFAADGTLDFLVLCSSLAAILGGFGQIDYAAANAYLDAFAVKHSSRRTLVVSVGWDAWDELGMAVETERRADVRAVVERTLATAMTPAEGIQVLDCILGGDACQVEVSTRPLQARLQTALNPPKADDALATLSPTASRRHPRPALSTVYEAPQTATERAIAELWSELLGIDGLGIHDSFFECGGHSLIAVQLLSKIREKFPNDIGIAALFECPTIAGLSRFLDDSAQRAPVAAAATSCAAAEIEHTYL